jgi:hypothetical protein
LDAGVRKRRKELLTALFDLRTTQEEGQSAVSACLGVPLCRVWMTSPRLFWSNECPKTWATLGVDNQTWSISFAATSWLPSPPTNHLTTTVTLPMVFYFLFMSVLTDTV